MPVNASGRATAGTITASAPRKPEDVTVAQFLDVITHGRRDETWLTYVPNIASTAPSVWFGGRWDWFDAAGDHAEHNTYYSLGLIQGGQRTLSNWACGTLIVLDDVSEKGADVDTVRAVLGDPTFVIQTSKGSQQVGYVLTAPVTDLTIMSRLQRALTLKFYPAQKDPGHERAIQYLRLPCGVNNKPKRIEENAGVPFPVRLIEWNPDAKADMLDIMMALGDAWDQTESMSVSASGLSGPQTEKEARDYVTGDEVLAGLDALGCVRWGDVRNGYVGVTCPWEHTHTIKDGSEGYNPESRHFQCFHSSHGRKTRQDIKEWLAAELGAEEWERISRQASPFAPVIPGVDVDFEEEIAAASLPIIKGRPNSGRLALRVEHAMDALVRRGDIYQRGRALVMITREPRGDGSHSIAITELNAGGLLAELSRSALWGYDKIDKDGNATFVEIDPDDRIAQAILSPTANIDKFPRLTGVIRTPFLRKDGTVAQTGEKPGYDVATGLYIDPDGVRFPEVKDAECTRAYALAALERLRRPISEYRFEDSVSEGVAVAGLMMPVVRPAIRLAPAIAIDAPVKGSGKTMLASLPSILATGEGPALIAQTRTETELDKQFTTALLHGNNMIVIDNVEGTSWGTPTICSALTSDKLKVRILGKSVERDLPNNASLFLTGNNLAFPSDTSRRFLVCRINPKVERPDTLPYKGRSKEEVARDRAVLVHSALTIVRGYILAGAPAQRGQVMGSYEEYTALVRDALMWLGLPDIARSTDRASSAETAKPELVSVLKAWKALDDGSPIDRNAYTAAELVDAANKIAGDSAPENPELHGALSVACPKGLTAQALGYWLRSNKGIWADGLGFDEAGRDRFKTVRWRLQTTAEAAFTDAPFVPTVRMADGEGFTPITD